MNMSKYLLVLYICLYYKSVITEIAVTITIRTSLPRYESTKDL